MQLCSKVIDCFLSVSSMCWCAPLGIVPFELFKVAVNSVHVHLCTFYMQCSKCNVDSMQLQSISVDVCSVRRRDYNA